jgi:hypothetical protein
VEADAGAHADDEVAEGEGNDLNPMDGVVAEPEQAGDGASEGDADQEGIVDPLLESTAAKDNAPGRRDCYGLVQLGDSHCERSISLTVDIEHAH